MARRARLPSGRVAAPRTKPEGRQPRPDIVHTSLYLPRPLYEGLRETAFKERVKIHDLVLEGIGLASKARGPFLDLGRPGSSNA